MKTREDQAARREASVSKMSAQLHAWSTRLDELVAGYLGAGAAQHDPYRLRIDGLKDRHGVVQTKFKEFNSQPTPGPWNAFRSEIAAEWTALEAGFKDVTRDVTPTVAVALGHA